MFDLEDDEICEAFLFYKYMENETKKECTKCKLEKEFEDFHKDSSKKYGLASRCKVCVKSDQHTKKEDKALYNKEYNSRNKDKRRQHYLKNREKVLEDSITYYNENKDRRNNQSKKWYINNKDRHSELNKNYYNNNKEKVLKYQREWVEDNRERVNQYAKEYDKNRRNTDPVYRLKQTVRSNIHESFKRVCNGGFVKKSKSLDILGCTIEEFIIHLQSLFTEGMTLENHGNCEECWHIDHKIPLASAETEEDIIKLNHYTNLQPLWRRDNLSKGKKLNYENTKNTAS